MYIYKHYFYNHRLSKIFCNIDGRNQTRTESLIVQTAQLAMFIKCVIYVTNYYIFYNP